MPRPKSVPPTAKARAEVVEAALELEEPLRLFLSGLDEGEDAEMSWNAETMQAHLVENLRDSIQALASAFQTLDEARFYDDEVAGE